MLSRRLTALLILFAAVRSEAQAPSDNESTHRQPDGYLIGASLGIPASRSTSFSPWLLTVGATVTQLHPNRLGVDLAVGTMPYVAFEDGILPIAGRYGIALPLVIGSHLIVLPSAGLSGVVIFEPQGHFGDIGVNAGVATVIHAGAWGLRAGVTYHRMAGLDPINLFEVGLVHVPVGP
jgi:hypothetical protein